MYGDIKSANKDREHIVDILRRYKQGTVIYGTVYDYQSGRRMYCGFVQDKITNAVFMLHNELDNRGATPSQGLSGTGFEWSYYMYEIHSKEYSSGIIDDYSFEIERATHSQKSPAEENPISRVLNDMRPGDRVPCSVVTIDNSHHLDGVLYKSTVSPYGAYILHNNYQAKGSEPSEGVPTGEYSYSWCIGYCGDRGQDFGCVKVDTFVRTSGTYNPQTFKRVEVARDIDGSLIMPWDSLKTVAKPQPDKKVEEKQVDKEPVMFIPRTSKKKMCDVIPMQKASIIKNNNK